MWMRVPKGIERGAAMVVPSRTRTPEAVMPSPRRVQIGEQWQYAVTVKRRSLGAVPLRSEREGEGEEEGASC
jgi:hypothetical protein